MNLDGKWYHMDTTWDDPTPDRKGKVSHSYYLLSDDEMARDHIWTGKSKYPAAPAPYREALLKLVKAGDSKNPHIRSCTMLWTIHCMTNRMPLKAMLR